MSSPSNSPGTAPTRSKGRGNRSLILWTAGGALVFCLAVVAVLMGRSLIDIPAEQAAVGPVIDQFMRDMSERNAQAAYQFLSSRARQQTSLADLTAKLDGPDYNTFNGYESVTINSTDLASTVAPGADAPHGLVATVKGAIAYTSGVTGTFSATLEKEGEFWRLYVINVTVSPGKE